MKKFELDHGDSIEFDGHTLYRVVAFRSFDCNNPNNTWTVRMGDVGGYIECEENLSQKGGCWITEDCKIYGDARVEENACLSRSTIIKDKAIVRGNITCSGCNVGGYTILYGNNSFTYANFDYKEEEVYKSIKVNGIVELIKKLSEEERHELYKELMSEDLL